MLKQIAVAAGTLVGMLAATILAVAFLAALWALTPIY